MEVEGDWAQNGEPSTIQLVGREAPDEVAEEWGDDFDLGDSEDEELPMKPVGAQFQASFAARVGINVSTADFDQESSIPSPKWSVEDTLEPEVESHKDLLEPEDEDDWDMDFDEGAVQKHMAGLLLEDTQETSLRTQFPAEYYLHCDFSSASIQIIKYPRPPALLTLLTLDGKKSMPETDVERWLRGVVGRFDGVHTSPPSSSEVDVDKVAEKFMSDVRYVEKYSVDWCGMLMECAWKMLEVGRIERSWIAIERFCVEIEKYPSPDEDEEDEDEDDAQERKRVFCAGLEMISLCAQGWEERFANVYFRLASALKALIPSQTDNISNWMSVSMAHNVHLLMRIERGERLTNLVRSLDSTFERNIDQDLLKDIELSSDMMSATIADSVLRVECDDKKEVGLYSKLEVAADALCSIHLCLFGRSPLTCVQFENSLESNYQGSGHSLSAVLLDTGDGTDGGGDEEAVDVFFSNQLDDIRSYDGSISRYDFRVKALWFLYQRVSPISRVKVKLAVALAIHALQVEEQPLLAESLLFDAVYALSLFDYVPGRIPSVMTELGIEVLRMFGDVLQANNKHKFGVVAYETSALAFKGRRGRDDFDTYRKIAVASSRNKDFRCCTEYYTRILEKAREEKNVNEVIYVSEVLSDIFVRFGDFRGAEIILIETLKVTAPDSAMKVTETYRVDSSYLAILLRLAEVYLKSYYFEKGIDLLETLMETELHRRKKAVVLVLLAKAYLKKGLLDDCERVLLFGASLIFRRGAALSIHDAEGSDWYYAASKYCLLRGFHIEAIFWLNLAATVGDTSSLHAQARIYMRKAHVFEDLLKNADTDRFPAKFETRSVFEQGTSLVKAMFSEKHIALPHESFSLDGKGSVLRQALRLYMNAYELFRTIGDDIQVAKCVLAIGRIQVDYVFLSSKVLGQPLDIACFLGDDCPKIDLARVEEPIGLATSTAAELCCLPLLFNCYLEMTKLRLLQGRDVEAFMFWRECRDLLFSLYMDETALFVAKGAPPSFLAQVKQILESMSLLLLFFSSDVIRKNTAVFDSLLLLEIEIRQAYKRPIEMSSWDLEPTVSSSQTPFSHSRMSHVFNRHGTMSDGSSGSEEYLRPPRTGRRRSFDTSGPTRSASFHEKLSGSYHEISSSMRERRSTHMFGTVMKGSGKTNSSGRSSSVKDSMESMAHLEKICERAWSYIYRQQQNADDFSNGSLSLTDLIQANQLSVARLYSLMKSLRSQTSAPMDAPTTRTPVFDQRSETVGRRSSLGHFLATKRVDSRRGNPDADLLRDYFRSLPMRKQMQRRTRGGTMDLFGTSGEIGLIITGIDERENGPESVEDAKKRKSESFPRYNLESDIMERVFYILLLDGIVVYFSLGTGAKYVHLIKNTATDPLSSNSKSLAGKHSTFDPDMKHYLRSLVLQSRFEKVKKMDGVDASSKMCSELGRTSFPGFTKVPCGVTKEELHSVQTPSESSTSGKASKTLSIAMSWSGTKESYPQLRHMKPPAPSIILLCSAPLYGIPWEMMVEDDVMRYFSLKSVSERLESKTDLNCVVPSLFSCYSTGDPKEVDKKEKARKCLIADEFLGDLHIDDHRRTGMNMQSLSIRLAPIQTPIIKAGKSIAYYQKKYRHMKFIETDTLSRNPLDIVTLVDNSTFAGYYPVFLFTFSDLLDLTEAILCLLSYRHDCSFLFVPEARMKTVTSFVMRALVHYGKSKQLSASSVARDRERTKQQEDAHKFFVWLVRAIRLQFRIPLIVYNPPTWGRESVKCWS